MALAQPRCVILRRELGERGAEFLDGFEVPHPQELLLEGPYRPLGDAIAFRLPDECRRTDHAETFDLILNITAPSGLVSADNEAAAEGEEEEAE